MGDHNTRPDDQPKLDDLSYRPNVNQVPDEPIPASHESDPRQETVEQNEQHSSHRSARPDGEVGGRP